MRVALVGWDLDEPVAGALAGLGVEVVAWSRWFADRPWREAREGWVIQRCPHQLGGGPAAEAGAFREAVLARWAEAGDAAGCDVVHALDPRARPAAEALAERSPTAARIGSIAVADVEPATRAPALPFRADRWISDHPWTAERWLERAAGPSVLVPTPALLERAPVETRPSSADEEPIVTVCVPRGSELDADRVARALAAARAGLSRLSGRVLGSGPMAEALRQRLDGQGLLARAVRGCQETSPARWGALVAGSAVVGVVSTDVADDPAAWAAWSFGVPVVRLAASGSDDLARAVLDALCNPARFEREVRAGAALAQCKLEPLGVALGWLRVYLGAACRLRETVNIAEPAPGPALGARTRLTLVAIGSRELYASWHVRPDDFEAALEWFGPDAVHAVVTLRLSDITDLRFHGDNAHFFWDVELGPAEGFRVIPLGLPGRSVVASLGLRSPRGYFHPLAHAGPTHMPREGSAPEGPIRLLGVIKRSFSPPS
jgi:hypothetical protein